MSTYRKALERFQRLERVRPFPRRCDRCSLDINRDDRVSVLEMAGGRGVMVVHERCHSIAQMDGTR